MSALYTTQAKTSGGRNGHVETTDGVLSLDLVSPKELGGAGGKTNPEQLFAAGYAACFESAARFIAKQDSLPLTDASVLSTVSLHKRDEGGFRLEVSLEVTLTGLDQATAEQLVAKTHQFCPYSNAVRGNIDVQLTTRAVQAAA